MKTASYRDIYYIEDEVVDLDDYMKSVSKSFDPTIKTQMYSVHWLAINGIQPDIPQNPSKNKKLIIDSHETIKEQETEENEEITNVKHVLSRELQLYYEKITNVLMGNDEALVNAALSSLKNDPVLHQLLPYLCQFISKQLIDNLHNLRILLILMKMVHSLLVNPNVKLDYYLHQIIPVVLTCLLSKRLCESPTENHWELRDLAAQIISYICDRWGKEYTNLQPKIIKTLVQALLDIKKPLPTHYGCIIGLTKISPHTIELIILPNLESYIKKLQPVLEQDKNYIKKEEAIMVLQALFASCGLYMYNSSSDYGMTEEIILKSSLKYDKMNETKTLEENNLIPLNKYYGMLYDIFGENLFPYLPRRRSDPGAEIFL